MQIQNPRQVIANARQLYQQKSYPQALDLCDGLLAQHGPHADVLTLKALINLQTGDLTEASAAIHMALERNPGHAGMLCTAAQINRKQFNIEQAKAQAIKAAQNAPDNPQIVCQSAIIVGDCGDHERGLQMLTSFSGEHPEQAEPWFLTGKFHVDLGNMEAAEEALRKAIEIQPGHAVALKLLVRVAGIKLSDTEILDKLQDIIEGSYPATQTAIAIFALADIHRKEGNFQKAFSLYRQANNMVADSNDFDPEPIEKYSLMVSSHSSGMSFHVENIDQAVPNMVFITGMPRSGTSLCEQVVSAHKRIIGCGELNRLGPIEAKLSSIGIDLNIDRGVQFATGKDIRKARSDYVAALPADHESYEWRTDKTVFNFRRLGVARILFPTAKVLFCLRHPLDTIISCYFRDFRSGGDYSSSLDHLARIYVDHIRMMEHWQEIFPEMIHTVRYPDMVNDLETQARAIADFLELDFDPAMLEPHLNQRTVQTASNVQVRRPVYTSAIGAWKNYEQELTPVIQHLQKEGILNQDIELIV